jgi:ParB/RepB/Spo0J family partition protein
MTEQLIKLELIRDNPYQNRETYADIDSLGRTIATHGLQELPKARSVDGHYQLKFGHRRKRAFEWLCENWQREGLQQRYTGYTVMPLELEEISDDEMFDGVVIENVHRDDLKPTEVARLLKRYMEVHPKATSKQVGLVFNMNDATVRGMVRLPDLPEDWQEKLDAGVISQVVARTGLSIQKIVPAKAMTNILKKVEKENGKRLPDAVIEDAIEKLPNVVQMWEDDRRDGKPRSDWHNGWALDMKNFPNKLLPALTADDIAFALDIPADQEQVANAYSWCLMKTGEIDLELEGADGFDLSPEALGLNDELITKLEHLIAPPSCTACPFYSKIRGTHFCGMKACHTRKTMAWSKNTLEQASKNLKIPVYNKSDGRFVLLVSYQDKHQKLFEKRDASLRLVEKSLIGDRYHYQSFKGVQDGVFCVAATGAALEKIATNGGKGGGGKKTEKEKAEMRAAEMRAMKIYRSRRKEFLWEYTAVAQGIFENVSPNVLKELRKWKFVGIDDRIPDEYHKDANYQRRALLWNLIVQETSHYRRESLVKLLNKFQELTQVKTPKALINKVTQWDEEIASVARTVSTETAAKK